jgi:predicted HAD superfamily Cof-like phosphohydrolase
MSFLQEPIEITQHPEPGLLENLEGPHEWGYRDPVEGGFIEDLAPFKGAERIRELEKQLADAKEEIAQLQSPDLEKLRYAVDRSAEQFEYYEQQHKAKETPEADAKAEVNRQLADMCRKALIQSDSVMRRVPAEVRPEPDCDYQAISPERQDTLRQNYSQQNNMILALRSVELIAPHWNNHVRNACADTLRNLYGRELTRFWCDIVDFHHKFRLVYDGPPRPLPEELGEFRAKFLQEELDEYNFHREKINTDGDSLEHREGLLDALVDLVYVALGTAYLHGFNFAEAWRRVQRANMAKVRAERADQSKRGSTFDVVKPEGWKAPDHRDLVGVLVIEKFEPTHASINPGTGEVTLGGHISYEKPSQHDLF